jgi:hypothetical protein
VRAGTAGKVIIAFIVAALVAPVAAQPAAAAVTVRRVGPADSTLVDMTPSGRYILVRVSSYTSTRYERVDTVTGRRVRVPGGDWGQITDNGNAVVGTDATGHVVVRRDIATGSTRRVRLPDNFDWGGSVVSIDAAGRTVGVIAFSGTCGCVGLFLVNTRTRRVTDLRALSPHRNRMGAAGLLDISADGSVVVFDLGPGAGGWVDVYVYRRSTGKVALAVRDRFGRKPTGGTTTLGDLSADGRVIVFTSTARNLVRGARRSAPRYFVRTLGAKRNQLLPITPSEQSEIEPVIDHDGSRVAYAYDGRVAGAPGRWPLVGRYDRTTATVTRMMGSPPPPGQFTHLRALAITATGRHVAYSSTWSLDPAHRCQSADFPCTYLATG